MAVIHLRRGGTLYERFLKRCQPLLRKKFY
jgi:hypothetical protein